MSLPPGLEDPQSDLELVAAFLIKTHGRYPSDEAIGNLLDPPASRSLVGQWRQKMNTGQPIGLKNRTRLALQKFLAAGGPTEREIARDAVRRTIAEVRAKLDEIEERLR